MPLELKEPRKGKTPNWYVRGTYLGITVDQSTGTPDKRLAGKILRKWKGEIERGEFSPRTAPAEATFLSAAIAYMEAGGESQYLEPILREIGMTPATQIDQVLIDTTAAKLFPNYPASTKNRQFYTPISAVLKHVGIESKIKRPKGWRGNKRTFWLEPEPTFRLLEAAKEMDLEFGIFCTLLNYCGLRLSEGLAFQCRDINLTREFGYLPTTKTEEPRAVFLPPIVVAALANHPRGLERQGRLFRFHAGGWLRGMLKEACRRSSVTLPRRTAFHVFRHNYGTWMRVYAGLDGIGLTRTGTWADLDSVERYSHSEPTSEARRATLLPTPTRGIDVDQTKRRA